MEEYAVPVRFAAPDLLNKRNMKLVLESLLKLSELATERRFRVQLPPISSLSLPSLDSLTPSHKRMVQNIVRFSKSRFTPIVPPRNRKRASTVQTKSIVRLQAIVRGNLERKKLRKIKRHNAYRSNVAKEILETETRYVESLKTCISHYMTPLQNASREASGKAQNTAPIIPKPVLRSLFSDLRIIYNFHEQSILSKILPRVESWNLYQCLGDIFLEIISMMKIYTQYISNYATSINVYRELETNRNFQEWTRAVEAEIGGKVLPFFLIMPVQRIPRYVLLLGDLLKHTWQDHPDYNNLQEATKKLQDLTAFLDTKEQEAENLTRLVKIAAEFQGMLKINLAEAHRKFIREDTFNGQNVYLFNDILLITSAQPAQPTKSTWKKRFSYQPSSSRATFHWIRNLKVVGNETGFQVLASGSGAVILDVTLEKEYGDGWLTSFKAQKRRRIVGPSHIRNSTSVVPKVPTITRDDSFVLLQQNQEVLRNHMFKVNVHLKTSKKKKEKKALSALQQNLLLEAQQLEKQIEQKKKTRGQLRRSNSVGELLARKV
eukprot:CAMPEP_0206192088 /NCGR_PEP_ID=MMETSP0166-20121206/5746_1 /ASSEMBLY_ACC=CAM_ASM_000260 /TAXON_ID=95228 /ORGANISM="Vannella robusta, Strain DIVA3 518/3/11/1/6" /LENGTH=546 /DNA_ID=CAMNT_0053608509 /DNA_START=241 /DNA_END=1881 /DNA_ORIENTATION=-